jgi:hypothetical protein
MGIKYFERLMVLKYHISLHRYIQIEMVFLDILSLGTAYQYAIKIEQKLKKQCNSLGLRTTHSKRKERESLTHRTKDREKMGNLMTTSPSHKQIRTMGRRRKIPRSDATSIRAPSITLLIVAQRSH